MVHIKLLAGRILPRHVTSIFCVEQPDILQFSKIPGNIRRINTPVRNATSIAQATKKELKSFKDIPGPPNVPLLGNVLGFKNPETGHDPKNVLKTARYLWEQYGDMFRLEVPGKHPIIWYVLCNFYFV